MDEFIVKIKKHKAVDQKWVLQAGKVYKANRISENKIEVINHYGNAIGLTLKEFQMYCEVIKKVK